MKFVFRAALMLLLTAPFGASAAAQTPAPAPVATAGEPLRVLIDCRTFGCDFDYFRTEIPFVDYVRDRQDSDVQVLVNSEETGGGGRRYTIELIGHRRMLGRDSRVRYTSEATASQDDVRRGLARAIKAGLVPYTLETAAGSRIEIRYSPAVAAAGEIAAPATPRDRWNLWVFSMSANGFLNGDDNYSSTNIFGSAGARRTTEAQKTEISLSNRYSQSVFDLGDREVSNIQRNLSLRSLAVWSVGDHWSAGGRSSLASSTFENQDLRARLAPAVEYSFFPYAESTRRSVTLQYSAGINYLDYEEITLFGKSEEMLADHQLELATDINQTWGSVDAELQGAQYLHDLSKNRLQLNLGLNIKVIKGLSFRLGGSGQRIRDQLFLPATELTPEEILLRQRALQTGFQYFTTFGLSYTFGSPFNNVVNPRFSQSSRR